MNASSPAPLSAAAASALIRVDHCFARTAETKIAAPTAAPVTRVAEENAPTMPATRNHSRRSAYNPATPSSTASDSVYGIVRKYEPGAATKITAASRERRRLLNARTATTTITVASRAKKFASRTPLQNG